MGFRENLKHEMTYRDIQVKELSKRSGVNVRTIHNYLSSQGSMPAADSALKIARSLGVSIESLIEGTDSPSTCSPPVCAISPEIRSVVSKINSLPTQKRASACKLLAALIDGLREF